MRVSSLIRSGLALIYIGTIFLTFSAYVEWPRLAVAGCSACAVIIFSYWPVKKGLTPSAIKAASVLVIAFAVDLGTAIFLGSTPYAGTYIGIGFIRILSWVLTLIGILMIPGDILGSAESSTNPRVKKVLKIALIAGAAVVIGAYTLFVSCGPKPEDRPKVSDFARIPNELSISDPATTFGKVGDCVSLSGADKDHPNLASAQCGDQASNYRIIAVKSRKDQCPTDSDQRFRQWDTEGQQTICLDYDWAAGSCMSIGGEAWHAVRVPCTTGKAEKPVKVNLDTTSVDGCPSGGFAHPVRRFTVCTETQK